jgi:hypothetical protein
MTGEHSEVNASQVPMSLRGANIVVLASNYNPSIASKDWLVRKGIITGNVTGFVHVPPMSTVETDEISLVVDEHRLQVTLKTPSESAVALLGGIVESFVTSLPETPYTAVGINYAFAVPQHRCAISDLFKPDAETAKRVFADDYELGVIVSFPFDTYRVRANVPPPRDLPSGEKDMVVLDFNFHCAAMGSDAVVDRLSNLSDTLDKAKSVVQGVCRK